MSLVIHEPRGSCYRRSSRGGAGHAVPVGEDTSSAVRVNTAHGGGTRSDRLLPMDCLWQMRPQDLVQPGNGHLELVAEAGRAPGRGSGTAAPSDWFGGGDGEPLIMRALNLGSKKPLANRTPVTTTPSNRVATQTTIQLPISSRRQQGLCGEGRGQVVPELIGPLGLSVPRSVVLPEPLREGAVVFVVMGAHSLTPSWTARLSATLLSRGRRFRKARCRQGFRVSIGTPMSRAISARSRSAK